MDVIIVSYCIDLILNRHVWVFVIVFADYVDECLSIFNSVVVGIEVVFFVFSPFFSSNQIIFDWLLDSCLFPFRYFLL
jgi:hypothetical protein